MDEVKCPYCGFEQYVDHEDGYGFKEDEINIQACPLCDKYFAYVTTVTYSYDVRKCDCQNDGNHKWELTMTSPKCFSKMHCAECGEEREPTKEEREKFGIGTREDFFKEMQSYKKINYNEKNCMG